MLKFVTQRGLLALLILMLAVTLLFAMIHMMPGDPASVILGPKASLDYVSGSFGSISAVRVVPLICTEQSDPTDGRES